MCNTFYSLCSNIILSYRYQLLYYNIFRFGFIGFSTLTFTICTIIFKTGISYSLFLYFYKTSSCLTSPISKCTLLIKNGIVLNIIFNFLKNLCLARFPNYHMYPFWKNGIEKTYETNQSLPSLQSIVRKSYNKEGCNKMHQWIIGHFCYSLFPSFFNFIIFILPHYKRYTVLLQRQTL